MREEIKATKAFLKRLPPDDAELYINSFHLPDIHNKIMYYLYVKKVPDIWQVKYKLEADKTFISGFKAGNLHRESLDWIVKTIKSR